MSNRKARFCFNTMVKNEAPTILRMLNSIYSYIDYWVIQDNGSTDGTQDIIRNFFQEKGIPGYLYELDWWKGHGPNRDHAVTTALASDHGCDWILRVDADEELFVDSTFDWSIFDDISIQSFNVCAQQNNIWYLRCWIWNAKLPWRFYPDTAHERIYLEGVGEDFQRVMLDKKFRHIVSADGMTWNDPMKFLKDALSLEMTNVPTRLVTEDHYHLWYIAKSYTDCYSYAEFPFGRKHSEEYARRAIFYYEQFLDLMHPEWKITPSNKIDEFAYMSFIFMSEIYKFLGDIHLATKMCFLAEGFCPRRNEHLVTLAKIYESIEDWNSMVEVLKRAIDSSRKNPFPEFVFLLDSNIYYDTSNWIIDYLKFAKSKIESNFIGKVSL